MTLPYLPRLLCLCFSFFFLWNAVSSLLLWAFSKPALRFAETRGSSRAANFLLAVRLLPFAVASLFVALLCVPSYLRLEPAATAESVGLTCVVLGSLGLWTWVVAVARTLRAAILSFIYCRRVAKVADTIHISEYGCRTLVVNTPQPLLALGGVFRPRLLISRGLLRSLSLAELDAALTHEQAHRTSHDNLKRLLCLLAPDAIPFLKPLRALEHSWYRLTEWAADDHAANGSSQRALSLAGALLRVARLGATPALPYLATSLLASNADLHARVNRLLDLAPAVSPSLEAGFRLRVIGLLSAAALTALLLASSALAFVHELQELLVR